MALTEQESCYLKKRQRLLDAWRFVGPAMMLCLGGFIAFVFINSPLLINPYEIISRIERGVIDRVMLESMAYLLPVVFIMVCFLLVMILAIIYMAFSNERKYQELLRKSGIAKIDNVE